MTNQYTTSLHKDNKGLITDPKSSHGKSTILQADENSPYICPYRELTRYWVVQYKGEPWVRQYDCLASLTTGIVEEEVHRTQKRDTLMLDICYHNKSRATPTQVGYAHILVQLAELRVHIIHRIRENESLTMINIIGFNTVSY